MRVQADHWAVILEMCETYPQIITNKFSGVGGRQENILLWQKLSNKLNSLGFGEKTVDGWKKTLIDWKSKTKAKAGAINSHKTETGGGPACALKLNDFEERLLTLMGKTSYLGNPINIERGFRKRKLFNEVHYEKSDSSQPQQIIPEVHTYSDHSYTSQNIPECIVMENDIPISNEEYTATLELQPRVIRDLPMVHNSLHSSSPSISRDPVPSTSKYTYISSPITAPSLQKQTNHQPKIPLIGTETEQENTPRKNNLTPVHNTKKNKPRYLKRTDANPSLQLEGMHNDLLQELKNINNNIALIANSLSEISLSLKK